MALVIAWSAREPERIGETALLGPDRCVWLLGRAPGSADSRSTQGEEDERTVLFFRQRPPGANDRSGPYEDGATTIQGEAISRRQLELRPRGEFLLVRNVGRCSLLVNGQPRHEALVRPGDTLHLRNQLVLYCTRRTFAMPPLRVYPKERAHIFGQADLDGIVGESPPMWLLRERIAASARTNLHVLITGESGTGKELAAQAVHRMSSRAEHKMIADNIATIAPSLASAVLFGNRRNFPNPGMEERVGLIGAAHRSTLFLDEIGDMPEEVQPMFLRVTERDGEYFRLGDEGRPQHSDFRLIGATNHPEGMRYELKRRFQREVHVPGLNERKEDIPLLVNHILLRQAMADDVDIRRFVVNGRPQIHPQLIELLLHHTYTTHVSEVAFLLGQAMAESPYTVICPPGSRFGQTLASRTPVSEKDPPLRPGELPSPSRATREPPSRISIEPPSRSSVKSPPRPLPSRERAAEVLVEEGGDVTRAAAVLNISRDQMNRLIRREGLLIPKARRIRRPGGDGTGPPP